MPHTYRSNHVFINAVGPIRLHRVMLRPALRHTAVFVLLAGFIVRAASPMGYMPAAPGSGLLFELCPGQLPAGVSLPGRMTGHDHHHHGADDDSQPEPDQCQIGHLLSSAAAVDDTLIGEVAVVGAANVAKPRAVVSISTSPLTQRSRDPPA